MRWELVGAVGDRDHLAFPVLKFTLPDARIVETDEPTRARIEGGFTGAAPTMVNGFLAAVGSHAPLHQSSLA